MTSENSKTILLGVTGGIGAYKSCELVRTLQKRGFHVKVVMTDAATRFVGPLTFRTLTGEPVAVSLWQDAPGDPVHHVSLAQEASVLAIAPCTANVLAKLACGRADDMLTTTALATEAPLVLAPAMNERMWEQEATRANVATLRERGAVIVGPGVGELACGDEGVGRLADVSEIADAIEREATRIRSLDGVRILVTAGGTREPLDPVRFLGNRSSGRMGFAVAEEAARRGAVVTVVAGAVSVAEPFGCEVIRVETAQEMRDVALMHAVEAQVVIAAAAVADYRPVLASEAKIKKADVTLSLELERTPDVLSEIAGLSGTRTLIGFAAETERIVDNAREKLASKGLDLVVANDVSRAGMGFESMHNQVVFVTEEAIDQTDVLDKRAIAGLLLDRVVELLGRDEGA